VIVDADATQLEVTVACEVSRDKVLLEEILAGVDRHSENAKDIFGDIKYRQEAKAFSFALQYGATPYMFFADPKFPNFKLDEWESIVEAYYAKYKGLKAWQDKAYKLVCATGQYKSITGRIYSFKKHKTRDGTWEYKRSEIVNYPIQGLATGDVMPLAMIHLFSKIIKISTDIKLINQVHDSIIIDSPDEYLDQVSEVALSTFENIPKYMKDHYGYDWLVPLKGEVKYGQDWSNQIKYEGK
jgi:DNA polymerase I